MPDAAQSLHRDDFTLYNFDHLRPQLDETLASVEVRRGEPSAPLVADAIFIPATEVPPRLMEGALLTSDGLPIPQARAERRKSRLGDIVLGALSQPVELRPTADIAEEVVYLGWYFDHFGHFLLESLARTWILPRLDPAMKVVFHRERPMPPAGITRQMLELLDIPLERILFLDAQTRLRRVIVPEPLYEISYAAHERMPEPYRRIADIVGGGDEAASTSPPVYLSRRLLPSRQRPIIGELELEEICRENGFDIVHPETITLTDQIRTVNRHREIFVAAGSAAYLSLFALGSPRLHVLTDGVPYADYFLIPKLARIEASYVSCLDGGHRPAAHYLPQLVDLDRFSNYLDAVGLRTRQRRAAPSPIGDLRPAYDESWFYKYIRHGLQDDTLPTDLGAEAERLAATSWPLSWALARYFARKDPERVEPLIHQFIALLAAESDSWRLAHYRDDLAERSWGLLRRSSAETAAAFRQVFRERLQIELADQQPPNRGRRRVRPAGSVSDVTGEGLTAATEASQ